MKHLLYLPILCFSLALSQDATATRDDITYTFTNCGQTGRTGPSQGQCDSEYGNDIDVNVEAGYHTVVWDADNHASGMYFVKMHAGNYISTQKLMLVK